jgi:hypothetical protein
MDRDNCLESRRRIMAKGDQLVAVEFGSVEYFHHRTLFEASKAPPRN